MKKGWANFRFKSWHFVLVLVILIVATGFIGSSYVSNISDGDNIGNLTEITDDNFLENMTYDVNLVLFYSPDSDPCKKMEQNINEIASEETTKNKGFYKIDANKYPALFSQYNIPGIPSTLMFNKKGEVKRIVGVVPVSNLKMILKRVEK